MENHYITIKIKVPVETYKTSKESKRGWEDYIQTALNSFQYQWDSGLQMNRLINEVAVIMKEEKYSNKEKVTKCLKKHEEYRMESFREYKEFLNKPKLYETQR